MLPWRDCERRMTGKDREWRWLGDSRLQCKNREEIKTKIQLRNNIEGSLIWDQTFSERRLEQSILIQTYRDYFGTTHAPYTTENCCFT